MKHPSPKQQNSTGMTTTEYKGIKLKSSTKKKTLNWRIWHSREQHNRSSATQV